MKQSLFIVILTVLALIAAFIIFYFVFGSPMNFKDGAAREVPLNLMGQVYTGGPLVALLIALSIMDFAIIIERTISLRKAMGKTSSNVFFKSVMDHLRNGEIDEALNACKIQKGSVANIISAALTRYKEIEASGKTTDVDKKLAEVQRAAEEATMLETPLLEKNLIALSTIASIATMVGLLGTTIGMIRAFKALAQTGAPDAIQLATGISEALINTAGGLFVAILGIVAYNVFINNVDNFTYQVDEASFNTIQILRNR
ncbi:MAG: MotA/TolQ/ExbB proton channel family protein [Ignavibacteriaceae bacterium]|nr:MotA/TolQ/ExbB proton channel family protein [Ignavibacteriaceae bacterium]